MSRDVTDERRMAESLHEAERMETVGTLAGGLAHDFNNQLTAILGNATLLRHELSEQPRSQRKADDLVRSAEHCADLTAGLLAFARRGPTAEDAVDLVAVFRRAERLVRPSLPPEVLLEVSIDEETPPVAADARELQRVVTNLLINARDAVGDQGRIELAAVPSSEDGVVEITARDDGPGIEPHLLRRIFDPFFSTKGAGTGLGLSIVYGIAQAHGASIDVESTPGEGAVFHVRWPAADPAAAVADARIGEDAEPLLGATILLAEDEPGVRRLVREILEAAGHVVLEAEDGEQAARLFLDHIDQVNLALVDMSMPKATGLEALEQMRECRPTLPAIVMSGHPRREGVGEWPEDTPLLKKPCSPEVLLNAVNRALVVKRSTAQVG